MSESNRKLFHFCNAFVSAEIILWIIIQTSLNSLAIQYFSVILAFLFCFLFASRSKSYVFTQLALLCTVIADYFLVWRNLDNKLLAMLLFAAAQIFYFLRIATEETNYSILKWHLIARITVTVLVLAATVCVLGENVDALALVSLFYYANLFMNLIFSIASTRKSVLLIVGFACFMACDTFVGLGNIGPYLNVSTANLSLGFDPVWFFYVPSQTFLAISLLPNKKEKRV